MFRKIKNPSDAELVIAYQLGNQKTISKFGKTEITNIFFAGKAEH